MRLVPVSTAPEEEEEQREEVVAMEREYVDLPNGDNAINGRLTEPYHGATRMWDGREPYIKIGRMATLEEYRGRGIAQRLIDESLDWAKSHAVELSSDESREVGDVPQWRGLVLSHAQKNIKEWWGRMGFVIDEGLGVWWEEGIEHVGMWRRVEVLS